MVLNRPQVVGLTDHFFPNCKAMLVLLANVIQREDVNVFQLKYAKCNLHLYLMILWTKVEAKKYGL